MKQLEKKGDQRRIKPNLQRVIENLHPTEYMEKALKTRKEIGDTIGDTRKHLQSEGKLVIETVKQLTTET